MNKFFYDILRDKGSTKFSITKTLAFTSFMYFITYLITYTFFFKEKIDHTLVIELIGFIGALVGLKNNWGVKRESSNSNFKPTTFETKVDNSLIDKDEEGVF